MDYSAETASVYQAEEDWAADYVDENRDVIERGDVESWAHGVLVKRGYRDGLPGFRFDSDLDGFAGKCLCDENTILIHPEHLTRSLVLHELAHWMRWNADNHNSQFRGAHISLVRVAFGDEAADGLEDIYREWGLDFDELWASIPDPA